jgi:hypothetical protein
MKIESKRSREAGLPASIFAATLGAPSPLDLVVDLLVDAVELRQEFVDDSAAGGLDLALEVPAPTLSSAAPSSCSAARRSGAMPSDALSHFYRAIELDPNFASAYGMAAQCYEIRPFFGWEADRDHEVAETSRLARRAAELGKDDGLALSTASSSPAFISAASHLESIDAT